MTTLHKIVGLTLLTAISFTIFTIVLINKSTPSPISDILRTVQNQPPDISYSPIKTGYIIDIPEHQKIADLCNNKMYPANAIYVDYGTPINTQCDVNLFNSPP
jgi:hypothetical protein